MKLEEKIQVLRFCSGVFNAIFLILGLSISGCALWILFDKGSFLSILTSEELKKVAGGLLVVGLLVVIVCAVGCIGAHKEMKVLLVLYVAFLVILILGQLLITLVLLVNRNKIKENLDEAVDRIIQKYGVSNEDERLDRLLDKVQRSAECCGRRDPADWLTNSFIQSVNLTNQVVLPCSCFNESRCPVLTVYNNSLFGTGNFSYTEVPEAGGGSESVFGLLTMKCAKKRFSSSASKGCDKKLRDWLEENTFTIVGMAMSLVLIQVVQFALALNLYHSLGRRVRLKRAAGLIAADNADPAPASSPQTDQNLGDGEQNLGFIEPEDGVRGEGLGHPEHLYDNQNHFHPKKKFGV